jgi:hypothetical protein
MESVDKVSAVEKYITTHNMEVQTKKTSLFESVVNVVAGYGVAVLSQIVIFPFFGVYISLSANLKIGLWFTAISIVRSFCIRRYFNWRTRKELYGRY